MGGRWGGQKDSSWGLRDTETGRLGGEKRGKGEQVKGRSRETGRERERQAANAQGQPFFPFQIWDGESLARCAVSRFGGHQVWRTV